MYIWVYPTTSSIRSGSWDGELHLFKQLAELSNSYVVAVGLEPCIVLQWRHNRRDGVSNHRPRHYLLKHLFRRRSKKTSKLRVTGLWAGNSPATGEFPTKFPVKRKIFPFNNVIMEWSTIGILVMLFTAFGTIAFYVYTSYQIWKRV